MIKELFYEKMQCWVLVWTFVVSLLPPCYSTYASLHVCHAICILQDFWKVFGTALELDGSGKRNQTSYPTSAARKGISCQIAKP